MALKYIQIIVSIDSEENGKKLISKLLENRLIACGQIIGPGVSMYLWKGGVAETKEWYCFLKTNSDLFDKVAQEIKLSHTYEIPEIIGTPIEYIDDNYSRWMDDSIKLVKNETPRIT